MTTPCQRALILYRRWRFINHLLTYLEPPSVEDDVDVWCYAILELHARHDDDATLEMLPSGKLNSIISESLTFYSESYMMIAVTVL